MGCCLCFWVAKNDVAVGLVDKGLGKEVIAINKGQAQINRLELERQMGR